MGFEIKQSITSNDIIYANDIQCYEFYYILYQKYLFVVVKLYFCSFREWK